MDRNAGLRFVLGKEPIGLAEKKMYGDRVTERKNKIWILSKFSSLVSHTKNHASQPLISVVVLVASNCPALYNLPMTCSIRLGL